MLHVVLSNPCLLLILLPQWGFLNKAELGTCIITTLSLWLSHFRLSSLDTVQNHWLAVTTLWAVGTCQEPGKLRCFENVFNFSFRTKSAINPPRIKELGVLNREWIWPSISPSQPPKILSAPFWVWKQIKVETRKFSRFLFFFFWPVVVTEPHLLLRAGSKWLGVSGNVVCSPGPVIMEAELSDLFNADTVDTCAPRQAWCQHGCALHAVP